MAGFPLQFDNPGGELRHVRIRPQAAGQPVKDSGNNVAAARTGVGVLTFTFSDKPKGYAGFVACVGNSLAHDVRPLAGGYVESTGTLTVTTFADSTTGAAAADIAVNANNTVDLWVLFKGQAKI